MPYIHRTPAGAIDSLHRQRGAGADEFLPDHHAEVQAFVGRTGTGDDDGYSKLDADFVRVLEDVIDTLIVKNILNITDLPPPPRSPGQAVRAQGLSGASIAKLAAPVCALRLH